MFGGVHFSVGWFFDCYLYRYFGFAQFLDCFEQFINLGRNIIELIHEVHILLGNKIRVCCDVEQFFLLGSVSLYVTSVGLSII